MKELHKTVTAVTRLIRYGSDILTPGERNRIDILVTDLIAGSITLAIAIAIFLIAANA